MTLFVPKRPDPSMAPSLVELGARFYRFAVQVVDTLERLPTIEWKTISTDGGEYPLYVETLTPKPFGVVLLRSYLASDPSSGYAHTSIAWYPSDDPDQPGIVITELGAEPGPSPGDEIECVILVLGERG